MPDAIVSPRYGDDPAREPSAGLDVPVQVIGGLPIAVVDRARSARMMIDVAVGRRNCGQPPLVLTSANGQVLSLCTNDARVRGLFMNADLIHADGMPLVLASRWLCRKPLPERVATTDLFHDVAAIAQHAGVTFYMLGATDQVIAEAVRAAAARYPRLRIVGHRSGYFGPTEEPAVIEAINAARPDILWVGMGIPAEQDFALRNRKSLRNVGMIKTSGGLYDFLSGRKRRAPAWMQAIGLEWAFRTALEPRRLAWRYMITEPACPLSLAHANRPTEYAGLFGAEAQRRPAAGALGRAPIIRLDVRFAPKATQLLPCRKVTRWANALNR